MEYEIRPMAASKRISDTLPRSGRVNEVCKEWLVHEDEALAYRLQKQEVEEHYTGNRYRNAQVREDFPKAKIEQEKELEEATSRYRQMINEQAEIDSSYARQIAAKLEQDEKEKIRLEVSDKKIAKKIQKQEVAYARQFQPCIVSSDRNKPLPNVNEVGLPLMEAAEYQNNLKQANFAITHNLRALKLIDRCSNQSSSSASCDTVDKNTVNLDELPGPSYLNSAGGDHALFTEEDLKKEAERRLQEERDAELAKLLQEQEEEINQEAAVDRDRLLAIEAQDKELAKLLQEKEKARLRRARERAKQKALLKKQLQQSAGNVTESGGDIGANDSTASDVDNSTLSSSRSNGSRTSENDNSESGGDSSSLQNIAMVIDPTYQLSRSDTSFSYLDNTAPPYMPIQGQRRTSSWEKKQKKSKHKEGCKQQ